MRIGSLFAGIGGLELGLEWAGVGHTVWQVERDPYCQRVLAKHWPNATRYDDVCTVGAHNLEPVDVICGGFPCQDISYAGKGAGLAGHRSGLWFEFARIVGELGPRYVVVENVAALLTRGLDAVLGTLADLGYDAEWSTLRASDVGAPHRRERVFLIAWTADADARGSQVVAERHGHALHDPADRDSRGRDADGCGGYVEHPAITRRETSGASGLHGTEQRQPNAGHDAMGDPSRGGRRTGAGLDVRRAERGCDRLDDTNGDRAQRAGRTESGAHAGCDGVGNAADDLRRPLAGGVGGSESAGEAEAPEWRLRGGDGSAGDDGPEPHGRAMGDADDEGPQGHGRPVGKCVSGRWDAAGRHGAASGAIAGWSDATPVRGADGTVRLIPAEAAQAGAESALWPVAHGVPGRVARLRAIGNAVVPQCAYIVGRRLLAIDAALAAERAA